MGFAPGQAGGVNPPAACPHSVATPVLRAAASVSCSAYRRRQAANGVSPGWMNLVPSGTGSLAPPRTGPGCGAIAATGDAGESAARSAGVIGTVTGNGASVLIGVTTAPVRDPLADFCRRRRLAGVRPSSRLSHSRRVSWPMLMPSWRRPPTSEPTELPVWRSRSNSSRCGASWATARSRGQRARSTASASVGEGAGVTWECAVSDMGVIGGRYAQHQGGARGAPRARSKRKRLDVGVLPYFFVFFLLGEAGFFFGSFIGWLIELVDCLVFVRGVFVKLVSLSRWFAGFAGHFTDRIILGSFDPGVVVGGSGC